MTERWVLNRAGIINVYQYGDETIEFGGGRLLLRGVNGSGKSTAMNMLLPFLLEADTRRIDAAGEQMGVLRSWMLSGREEQQPQGYLWIELRHGDRHLAFGCGIRANRTTERVTTWWFVTDRRPGIDLALVQQRTALSLDALRAEIGSNGTVYTQDQRAAYRADLANQLYGGADLDQHLRLLHVVRNPRVGDRIDHDLPRYLEGALPQLSESALDDAAQPLEDLEEHRRNVEDLTTTSTTLDALAAVYHAYARTEIHRRTADALATVTEADRRKRAETTARDTHRAAVEAEAAAAAEVERVEHDQERLRVEIDALKASDAYRSGTELVDLRAHVRSLEDQLANARKDLDRRDQRVNDATDAVAAASHAAEAATASLGAGLVELNRLAAFAGLGVRPPDLATTPVTPADDLDPASPPVPSEPLDIEPHQSAVRRVAGAATTRQGDVRDVLAGLERIERAERELDRATTRHADATERAEQARAELATARDHLRATADTWSADLDQWADRLAAHRHQTGLAPIALAEHAPALVVDHHRDVRANLLDAAQRTVGEHETARAGLSSRRQAEQAEVAEHEARVAELAARTFPATPTTSWQRADAAVRFAEVVDFADTVDDTRRAGLEAALEASGLLGAELQPDGALHLDDEALVVRPGPPVASPLADLLVVTVPDELAGTVDAGHVEHLLGSITVAPEALDHRAGTDGNPHHIASADTAPTADTGPTAETAPGIRTGTHSATADPAASVVTDDGRFRVGALVGRHTKDQAEHIGVTARRAALERQRRAAADELAAAEAALAATDDELSVVAEAITTARATRDSLPTEAPVVDALARSEHADRTAEQAAAALDDAARARDQADRACAEAIDANERLAATLGLPTDRAGLQTVEDALADVRSQCRDTSRDLTDLASAVGHWITRGRDWLAARDDRARSGGVVSDLEATHEPLAMRLATLEDAIGLEYAAVLQTIAVSERDLEAANAAAGGARQALLDAHGRAERTQGDVARAEVDRQAADARCAAALPILQDALAVDGFLKAALGSDLPTTSSGPDTAEPDTAGPGPGPDDADADPATAAARTGARTDDAPPVDPRASLPVVAATPDGLRELARAVSALVPPPTAETGAESVRMSLRQRRATLGAGWDAEDHQPDESLPLLVEVNGPLGRMSLVDALDTVGTQLRRMTSLLSAKQDQALRNLLQGLIAKEVADKLHAAGELVARMNERLDAISTSHGIGVSLRWRRRDDLDPELVDTIALLAKPPDLRTPDEDHRLAGALAQRIATARADDPEQPYRELVAEVLDYRSWHRMTLTVRRPGREPEVLGRRTALSEGEKKMVSYLPLFAAVAASCDALSDHAPDAPRFVLLDDAFAKVSEDNHPKLFGLLVELDLDFIATSERLWGTHATVPSLAITEVLRDAELGVIVLEHSRWDGRARSAAT